MIDEEQLNQFNVQKGVMPARHSRGWSGKKIGVLITLAIVLAIVGALAWRTWYFYKLVRMGAHVQFSQGGGFTINPHAADLNAPSNGSVSVDRANAPSFGKSAGAPLTIVEFADFECPFSRDEYPAARSLMAAHAQDVRFVYRYFPLSDIHPHALKAAEAAACAGDQGKFWPYHDMLYQNQNQLGDTDLKRYAAGVGLDQTKFNRCLDMGAHRKEVLQDYEDGVGLGVRGTPTFFVNGHKVEGVISADDWEKLLTYFKQ